MNENIESLLHRASELEKDLNAELKTYEAQFSQSFSTTLATIKQAAHRTQENISQTITRSSSFMNWRHIASIPIIYSMIFPLAFLDLTISFYQTICFRLYGIARVKRAEHFVIDRQFLSALNGIDKFNCVYCGYGNGVMSYAREIVSRTEQYWCPIKHAQKVVSSAERYGQFLEYGDTENYHKKMESFRDDLR